ncbi:hypothetical protein CC2G_004839 [Coprinopsis cinerea AmutBmut pab1-1]|nr:hypothetical protein CC2G_004839 [Coprinopsis cinerea AmutBmut pab1-1]
MASSTTSSSRARASKDALPPRSSLGELGFDAVVDPVQNGGTNRPRTGSASSSSHHANGSAHFQAHTTPNPSTTIESQALTITLLQAKTTHLHARLLSTLDLLDSKSLDVERLHAREKKLKTKMRVLQDLCREKEEELVEMREVVGRLVERVELNGTLNVIRPASYCTTALLDPVIPKKRKPPPTQSHSHSRVVNTSNQLAASTSRLPSSSSSPATAAAPGVGGHATPARPRSTTPTPRRGPMRLAPHHLDDTDHEDHTSDIPNVAHTNGIPNDDSNDPSTQPLFKTLLEQQKADRAHLVQSLKDAQQRIAVLEAKLSRREEEVARLVCAGWWVGGTGTGLELGRLGLGLPGLGRLLLGLEVGLVLVGRRRTIVRQQQTE